MCEQKIWYMDRAGLATTDRVDPEESLRKHALAVEACVPPARGGGRPAGTVLPRACTGRDKLVDLYSTTCPAPRLRL